jgi:hypothetical protein
MPKSDDLRAELRIISTLLMPITAANCGYPTLIPSNEGVNALTVLDIDHDAQTSEFLNSMAVLLVRNNEIVAITALPLSKGFIAFTNTSITGHHFHKDLRHQVKLVETAQSHWPVISMREPMAILDPENLR